MRFVRWLLALCLLALFVPGSADACAVCFSGSDDTREAFYITALGLTVLPLAMGGSVGGWLFLRFRKLQRESPEPPRPSADLARKFRQD